MSLEFINKSACRRYLLDKADGKWPGKFTRVAENIFEFLDACVRSDMTEIIRSHPTLGKTITTGIRNPKEPDEEEIP